MPVLHIKTSEANDALNDLLSAKKEMKELLENLKKTSETLKRVRSLKFFLSDYQVKVNQEKKKVEIDIYKLEGFIKSYASFLEYAQTRDNSCGSTLSDSGYKYRSDTGLLSKEQDKESEDKKKIAIGVGIIGGLALTAFFLPVLLPELAAAGMVANACGNAALWGGIFGVIGYEKDGADGWLKGVLEGSSGSLLSELGEGKLTIEFLTNMAQGSINSYIENGDLSIDESAIDALESMVLSLTGKKIKATSTMTKENISAPEFKNVNDINEGGGKAKLEVNQFNGSGKLKPNIKYKTGEFDYLYETDGLGRINKFQTDNLKLTERESRLSHNPDTPGKLDGDHAGHLAGDRFGGSPELDNLVSQASNVNLSQYKKIENQWAKAIKEGKKVKVNVEIKYNGDSLRPSKFIVQYEIDGKPFSRNILN